MVNASSLLQSSGYGLNNLFSGVLGKLIVTLLILLIGFIIGRIVARVVEKILHEVEVDKNLSKLGFSMPIEHTIATILAYLIYLVAIVMALNQIGLSVIVLYIIVGGAVLLIIISTVLGVKDFIPNMIAGLFIYRKKLFKVGQKVMVKNVGGRVRKISLIETELVTGKGDVIYIPNSLLVKSTVMVRKR